MREKPKDTLKPLKILVFVMGAALIAGLGATIYLISTKSSSNLASGGIVGGSSMTGGDGGLACAEGEISLPLEGEIDRVEMHGGLAYIYYAPQGYAPAILEIWDVCAKERRFRLVHAKE